MKRLRFLLAIVLHVVLLAQASVLGGLAACADDPMTVADGQAGAPSSVADAHAGHTGPAPAEPVDERAPQQRTPAPSHPSHCVAASGCAAVALASVDLALASPVPAADDAPERRAMAPTSVHRTPEPPPPRA